MSVLFSDTLDALFDLLIMFEFSLFQLTSLDRVGQILRLLNTHDSIFLLLSFCKLIVVLRKKVNVLLLIFGKAFYRDLVHFSLNLTLVMLETYLELKNERLNFEKVVT